MADQTTAACEAFGAHGRCGRPEPLHRLVRKTIWTAVVQSGARPARTPRTLSREGARTALAKVREVAERDKKVQFTVPLHHVYNVEHLRAAYYALKRHSAPGIDGETWEHYGQERMR